MRHRSQSQRRSRLVSAPSRLRSRDLGSEVVAGLLQRPGRSALTLVGTVLGIGAFVAIVGLSQTASGQIGKDFNALDATQVTVTDKGAQSASVPTLDFPSNADALVDKIKGVIAAGVWWNVALGQSGVSARPGPAANGLPVVAATPGALAASGATVAGGVLFNLFHQDTAQNVALLSETAARQLGISNLEDQPAIFIGDDAFTVIGIISGDKRIPSLDFSVIVPESTALRIWGKPTSGNAAQMLIHTKLGAGQVVAGQVPVALAPRDPKLLKAAAPVNPAQLQRNVTTNLNAVFLALAGIAVVVGAVGIANTTLVAVLERASEIGLRRALGARPRHIAIQFLCESTALGLFGGMAGACIGVLGALAVTIDKHWTALMDPRIVLAAPVAGAVIGLLAGLYPALRASAIEPADALRR
ncbi:MAG TPA: ABC transporter permease [Streptosporangiaceae bacterium]|nr:ABC transporter permease [Streptosporangiaceae bacterium]